MSFGGFSDPFGGANGFGFQVPQGDPGAVSGAAAAAHGLGGGVAQQSLALTAAARTAVGVDGGWRGSAASAYSGYSEKVTAIGTGNAAEFGDAAAALSAFAHALEHAQSQTRAALRQCEQAQSELTHHQAVATQASGEAETLNQQAANAFHPQAVSSLHNQAQQAAQRAQAAERAAQAAQRALDEAKRRGRRADQEYRQAARAATAKLQQAAAGLKVAPTLAGGPPPPVSVTPQDITLANAMANATDLKGEVDALADPSKLRGLGCGQLSPGAVLAFLARVQRDVAWAKLRAEDRPLDGSIGGVIPGPVGQFLQGAWNTTAATGKLIGSGVTHPGSIPGAVEKYLAAAAAHPGAWAKSLIDYDDLAHGNVAKAAGTVAAGLVEAKGVGKVAGSVGRALPTPDGVEAVTRAGVKVASAKGVPVVGDLEELIAQAAKAGHPDNAAARALEIERLKRIVSKASDGPEITKRIIQSVNQLPRQVEVRVVPPRVEPPPRPPAVNPRTPMHVRGAPRGR